jgi:Rod binding domain-containing protein
MTPPVSNAPPVGASGDVPAPRDVKQAATQFEALLISQMLKSMREAGESGWLGTGEDQAGGCMMELAEEHLSQVLAAQGGLGMANLVVKGLTPAKP